MWRRWIAALTLVLVIGSFSGCVKSNAVVCSDGTLCAPGTTCSHGQCVSVDQLTSCSELTDGDVCPIPGQVGLCRDGVCLAIVCGDGLAQGNEQCDGAPPATTCLDSGYDAGFLGCVPAVCAPAFADCRRVGWKQVAIVGTGSVMDISGVDDVGFAARGDGVLRFDGTTWAPMVLPGNSGITWSVFAASPSLAFAVTEDSLFRFDGAAWQLDPQGLGGSLRGLLAGSSTTDVYLFLDAAVYRFDGQAWALLPSAPARGRSAWVSNGEGWVADGFGTLHRGAGAVWTTVTTPLTRVDAVRGFGSTVFIAGWDAADLPVVSRWDGSTWQTLNVAAELGVPPLGLPQLVLGGRGATDVYVFARGQRNLVHFDGATWQRTASLTDPVSSMAAVGPHLFSGLSTGIARESASSIVEISDVLVSAGASVGGAAVWGRGCDDVFVASSSSSLSDGGRLFHFDGTSWVLEHTQPMDSITDLHGTDGDVYATTSNGDLLRRTGTTWSVMRSFPNALRGVWSAPGGFVVVVGANGWVHRFAGTWTSVQVGSQELSDVWGSGPDDLHAVRSGQGPLLHFDGTQWTDVSFPFPVSAALHAIWGDADGGLIAVGTAGEALHREDGVWRRDPTMPFDRFRAIHGAGPSDVFALGEQGTIAHYDGTRWAPVRSDAMLLRGAWTSASCTYFAGDYNALGLRRLWRDEPW